MARGMECAEDTDREPLFVTHGDVRLLERVQDYDLYCYFVAGTVGHMTTDLVIDQYFVDDETSVTLQDLCEACGRGLQKTNMIKDFVDDLSRGVCYLSDEWMKEMMYSPLTLSGASLSWRRYVLNDVMDGLRDFFSYILALPYQAKGYRLASLLCVLPACQTILKAAHNQDKLFTLEHDIKISRITFYKCIHDAKSLATSNEAIIKYSQNIEEQFGKMLPGNRMDCTSIIAELG